MSRPAVVRAWAALLLALLPGGTATAQVRIGTEATRDRALWHFENPSSYDTATLVPHFFEQDYVLDNLWLTLDARYRAGIDWHTTVAATPIRQALATDYDTFFNPGGVVWVAGTTGDARMHSFRLSQALELGQVGGVRLTGGYRLRIDLADFLDGDRTDVRNGTLVSRTTVTTREYTNGQVHEVFVAAERDWALRRGWTLRLSGDVAPTAVNRLAIRLPDKYPGRTLVYRTTNATTSGRLELTGGNARWPVTLSAGAMRSWNYSRSQWVRRHRLAAGISIGRSW